MNSAAVAEPAKKKKKRRRRHRAPPPPDDVATQQDVTDASALEGLAKRIEPGGASAHAARRLERSAKRGIVEGRCAFWFMRADTLRTFSGKTPPKLQVLRRDHPDWLEQRTISFVEGCDGAFERSILVVSHRWEKKEEPDPDGVQFASVRAYLEEHREIESVWFECVATPKSLGSPHVPLPPF